MIPIKSLILKYGWNGILSMFIEVPKGFEEPVSWRRVMWIITSKEIIKGIIKCNAKKRVKVGLSTENPPHSHWVMFIPM